MKSIPLKLPGSTLSRGLALSFVEGARGAR